MGRNSSGITHRSRRGSTRDQLIACAVALCACIGVIHVASPASADGPNATFTPLSTGWLDGAVLDDLIPAPTGDVVQYVIGGSAAADGEFPWMTYVLALDESEDFAIVCGGTLVAPSYVLTAAHCVENAIGAAVAVGTAKLSDLVEDSFVPAAEKVLHPEYVTDGAQADVALLRLQTPVTAPVVQLAHPQDATLSAAGVLATVTGWGLTDPAVPELSDDLQKGSMPIRSAAECQVANPDYVDVSNICAGYLTDEGFPPTGACLGDSGGPLLVATPDSRTRIQVGTVSYGPISGCVELDEPIVYMRVSFYLDWIEGITGDLAGPPETTTTTTSSTTTVAATTTTVAATTTTVAATTTTVAATTTTVAPNSTVAAAASPTTSATSSFAAPASGSSGGSAGSLAATGSSGWLTFVAWALQALILGRMTVLVARRPAIR